jgi:hypothetical protein
LKGPSALNDFIENMEDYARDRRNGDAAMTDLDAIGVACSLMEATGDYALAYAVMDGLMPW